VVLAVGTSHESGVGSGNAGLGWASASRRSPDHSFLCEQNTAASLCYEPSNLLMHRKCLVHHIVIIIIFVFHEIKWGNLLRFFEGGREGGRVNFFASTRMRAQFKMPLTVRTRSYFTVVFYTLPWFFERGRVGAQPLHPLHPRREAWHLKPHRAGVYTRPFQPP